MNRMKMKTEILPAEGEAIAKAADLLRRGELVALPTETVYGIAADARNGAAVAKIFVAKGRPQDNPLIVHVTGPEMLPGLVSEVPERAQLLMAAFCPGPLTIIRPRSAVPVWTRWASGCPATRWHGLSLRRAAAPLRPPARTFPASPAPPTHKMCSPIWMAVCP